MTAQTPNVDGPLTNDPTPQEIARGPEGAHDTLTMHQFESWKDRDLWVAVETEPSGQGHDEAVEEYLTELSRRLRVREEDQARIRRLTPLMVEKAKAAARG